MNAPPTDLSHLTLADIARLVEERTLPPVEQWRPEREGRIDIRIARDGSWYHEGDPIRRPALVRLFSTILRREPDGAHALVTPAEKLAIEVEDAPFIAVEMKSEGEGDRRKLAFRLNTADLVVAGPGHAIELRDTADGRLPYLHVRDGLWARIGRAPYYELAELALSEDGDPPGLWSDGVRFALAPA